MLFIGYPNWCGTMPMPVWSFLEAQNLSGKLILPFCTHEGSGLANSEKDLAKLCPDSQIANGCAIKGTTVKDCKPTLEKWLAAIQ